MDALSNGKKEVLFLKNLAGSSRALALAAIMEKKHGNYLFVHDDADQAAYLYYDLTQFFGKEKVLLLPASFKHSVKYGTQDAGNNILRTEVLNALQKEDEKIIIAYPESFVEKVLPEDELKQKTLSIHTGEHLDTAFVTDLLSSFGFTCTDYVYEPGQYSLRGSLIDVYSWSYEYPYRIDFFGDEVESIRSFEVETQLSKEKFEEIQIISENHAAEEDKAVPISHYFPENITLGFFDYDYCLARMNSILEELPEDISPKLFVRGDELFKDIEKDFQCIEFGQQSHFKDLSIIEFHCSPQESFGKNFDFAAEHIFEYTKQHYQTCLLSNNAKQIERIRSIFAERNDKIQFTAIEETLHEGFIDHDLKMLCYTDHQLFDRFHKYSLRSDSARSGKLALTLKELMQFQFGDYVVHLDHGVGKFGGLFRTEINGKMQEVIKIMYKDNDVIFVSIHNLHRIAKYRGKEGEEPTIHKLSSGAWEKIKDRSKKKIKDIARDLIKLYSARMQEKGFAYSPDSYLQEALEASFIYEDTPDQTKATVDVKKDMENSKPMDRLVCGDVGFGKTEIAVRAAFKAVTDGKQVAVLVPTTILAFQHYQTFKDRLKDYPCEVDYLSRTKPAAEIKKLLAGLKDGKPEILIGTHRIIGKDVHFKDLGLLIIDEEQKFGVSVKEKLRQIKNHIDTLTMTATPIPRTLQFSLMGARDLSVLSTPPANRYPIQTEIYTFDKEVIKEGIELEMERNGQVFFVNNKISDLENIRDMIRRIVPQARVAIAHGQMEGEKMEQIIIDFMNYEYDVLVCTSIVENGIDISNANTIFINSAHKFGLSDLHQLRGRVGRSNKKAYCYLLAPPLDLLTNDAKRRLQAIESFSELGSGLNIAMQDLDIRGAGNMLGAEQSGFIADLGFETYQRILKEALHELKEEEFSDLYREEEKAPDYEYVSDCLVESDLSLYFTEAYVPGSSERMNLYREMDQLEKEADIAAFEKRLIDRFGPIPQEGQDLIQIVRIRQLAQKLGIEKLILKNGQMICHFVSDLKSSFYQSDTFDRILQYVQGHFRQTKLREAQGKRSMVLNQILNTQAAYEELKKMSDL